MNKNQKIINNLQDIINESLSEDSLLNENNSTNYPFSFLSFFTIKVILCLWIILFLLWLLSNILISLIWVVFLWIFIYRYWIEYWYKQGLKDGINIWFEWWRKEAVLWIILLYLKYKWKWDKNPEKKMIYTLLSISENLTMTKKEEIKSILDN